MKKYDSEIDQKRRERLKNAMGNISARELTEMIVENGGKINSHYIYLLKSGNAPIKASEKMYLIASALNVSLDYLLCETSEKTDIEYCICKRAVDHYGDVHQTMKCIEEMSELTKALIKRMDYELEKDYAKQILQDAVDEEMADVEIMLEQMKVIFRNRDQVEKQKVKKLERLERRLDGKAC